ncbi:MAG: hypothetical protein KatS3mg002_0297 [Candidatus Woesearchaeota archaeon]|nr:MAG: hypothetical protein KatS3mg002_0297 [Candidatus Woesearchaeota archaeon]
MLRYKNLNIYLEQLFFEDDHVRHIKDILSKFPENNIIIYDTPKDIEIGLLRYQIDVPTGKVFLFKFPNEKERSFHTVGMTFPIDIYFFDKKGFLITSYKEVPPGVSNIPSKLPTKYVIEIPSEPILF